MKITHIVPGLKIGGAEVVLRNLLTHPLSRQHQHQVLCLGGPGPIGDHLQRFGIRVDYLHISPRAPWSLLTLSKFRRIALENYPDLIQSWMYHANLVSALLLRGPQAPPLVWALHQDLSDKSWIKPLTKGIIQLGALLSQRPVRIISVSQRAIKTHAAIGYPAEKFTVIYNGFEVAAYPPIPSIAGGLRNELELPQDVFLLGYFARYHPMKDHANFLAAAKIVHQVTPRVHFILAGQGVDPSNADLMGSLREYGLVRVVHLLGERHDIPRLLPELSAYSISSRSEGFPLAVGEAMAAGVPCVVTDAGDAGYLVGDTGLIVPPRDPKALASAWMGLIGASQARLSQMGRAAQARIKRHFSLTGMVAEYYRLYSEITDSA